MAEYLKERMEISYLFLQLVIILAIVLIMLIIIFTYGLQLFI